jgi:hypothetical protein
VLDVTVDQVALERAARQFEDQIYPRDRELFGEEWSPGVDGDPRLTVLNAVVPGVGGYFSAADGVVKAVNRFSNEREMIIMSLDSAVAMGSNAYQSTLAHEFQHLIHSHQQRRSPTWFSEGMSTLAQDLNGYAEDSFAYEYLRQPDLQLTGWSSPAAPHYGAAILFLRYFYEHYAGDEGIRELIAADAGNNVEIFAQIAARKRPDIHTFAQLYADWAIANLLDDPSVAEGRYAYTLLPHKVIGSQATPNAATASVNQFGVDYYGGLKGPMTFAFDGRDSVGLAAGRPSEGRAMWWSNRGDESVSTLSRELDLTGLSRATLQFSAWHELELNYDYAFVTISTDGGAHWATLKGETTTDHDPNGYNYGNGLNGVSGSPTAETGTETRGQWVEERMDLSPYAGKQVLLRFWVITDDATNAEGLLIDNIRIPELAYRDGAESDDGAWQAQGFVRTTGILPQTWELRLIRISSGHTTVEPVPTDAQGNASIQLGDRETGMLAVIGATHFSTEPAEYRYTITRP